ncbi:response regulator transcription factor [Pseudonocardia sp. S2-4]|uniref:Response regulator transcription factor n=1 Tax=Pseudonocardia humida TaxID=2800819 RepID=A0ABT1A2J6_9PSEU|nr:response regulator transcription factor [Pseudonocardia humida]
MARPSVVLIDDHPVVLAGMRTWFRRAGIAVLATGGTPDVAWRSPGAAADVVVLDPHPAGRAEPGRADLDRLVAGGRRVVVHTTHHDEGAGARCCRVGGAVVAKARGEAHLVAAVLAAAGHRPGPAPSRSPALPRPRLTARERDVLLTWLRCESKRTTATLCHVSPRTVEGYIDRVRLRYAEVGRPAPTKASLVARALQDGLLTLDDL